MFAEQRAGVGEANEGYIYYSVRSPVRPCRPFSSPGLSGIRGEGSGWRGYKKGGHFFNRWMILSNQSVRYAFEIAVPVDSEVSAFIDYIS